MKRTQIQLPENLYGKLKTIAQFEETSLADILRRAGEYYLSLYPDLENSGKSWEIPEPKELGEFLVDDSQWRDAANELIELSEL